MVQAPVPAAVRNEHRWELIEEETERLADAGLVTVDSTRALYDDRGLRERVREATGIDQLWRSFFASRLTTTPPLTRGIADLVVRTVARPQADRRFAADLESRGFRSVTRRDERTVDLGGRRGRATRFSAEIPVPVESAPSVGVDAWLAIWGRPTDMLVAGGIYPVEPLRVEGGDDLFAPPGEYRNEVLELVRAV